MNYSRLTENILDTAVKCRNVNCAFEGNIYEINSMNTERYPVFVVAATQPQVEEENYWRYYLTLYYIGRQQEEDDQYHNPDKLLIHSNGMETLSQVINELRANPEVIDIPFNIQYTIWDSTVIFNEMCCGVYCNIQVLVPKVTLC